MGIKGIPIIKGPKTVYIMNEENSSIRRETIPSK